MGPDPDDQASADKKQDSTNFYNQLGKLYRAPFPPTFIAAPRLKPFTCVWIYFS